MSTLPNNQDSFDRLDELADAEYPESWVPEEPGDTLTGEFVRLVSGTDRVGKEHPIAVIRDREGTERSLWLLHSVLLSAFKKIRPRTGERILVRRLKDRESAAGRMYRDYKVVVDRDTDSFDWDMLPSEHESADDLPVDTGRPLEAVSADDEEPF